MGAQEVWILIGVMTAAVVVVVFILNMMMKQDQKAYMAGRRVLLYNYKQRDLTEVKAEDYKEKNGWELVAVTDESEIEGFTKLCNKIRATDKKTPYTAVQMKTLFRMYMKSRWMEE